MIFYKLNHSTLIIGDKSVDFKYNLRSIKEVGDLLIVLYDNPDSPKTIDQPINNVSAVDNKGNIVWAIKDIITSDNLYTGMRIDENNNLVVVDFSGINYTIDLKNSIVVDKKGIK